MLFVRILLAAGADPNEPNAVAGETPLAGAVYCTRREMVDALVRAGADLNQRVNNNRMTPLGLAVIARAAGAVIPLIDAGADVNSWNVDFPQEYPAGYRPRTAEGSTPQMLASKYGNVAAVLMLLDRGAEPVLRNERGQTALDLVNDTAAEIRDALRHPERFAVGRRPQPSGSKKE
jgi:ankyrin repeat protein